MLHSVLQPSRTSSTLSLPVPTPLMAAVPAYPLAALGAVVGYAVLGEIVGADFLATVAGAYLGFAIGGTGAGFFFVLLLLQFGKQ